MTIKEMAEKVNNSAYSFIRDRLTPGLLITIASGIVYLWVTLDTKTFSSVEMKVNTENAIRNVTNLQRLDSIIQEFSIHTTDEEIHKPYAVMDSLWMPRKEIDSITLENVKYMNQISTQINETNRMVIKTNKMVQEFIMSQR